MAPPAGNSLPPVLVQTVSPHESHVFEGVLGSSFLHELPDNMIRHAAYDSDLLSLQKEYEVASIVRQSSSRKHKPNPI